MNDALRHTVFVAAFVLFLGGLRGPMGRGVNLTNLIENKQLAVRKWEFDFKKRQNDVLGSRF